MNEQFYWLNKDKARTALVNNAMIQALIVTPVFNRSRRFYAVLCGFSRAFIPFFARLFILMLTPSSLLTMTVARLPIIAVNKNARSAASILASRSGLMGALIVSGAILFGLAGCGQKGDLYLADNDSQMVTGSSEVLDSTSNPQDAAFAGVDDVDYQKTRYLEQKQVLPDVTDDPNDY